MLRRRTEQEVRTKVTVEYSTMIVRNMEESVALYEDVLGFGVVSVHELGARWQNHPNARTERCYGRVDRKHKLRDRSFSVGMDVDDLTETLEHARSTGANVTTEPMNTTFGSMAFIEDPV